MGQTIDLNGTLSVYSDSCAANNAAQVVKQLFIGQASCSGRAFYESSVCSSFSLAASAAEDIECLNELTSIELIYLRSNAAITVRVNAVPASVLAVGGSYPTGFVGTEILQVTYDGVTTNVDFQAGDQTLTQVINRINSEFALEGYTTSVVAASNGQLLFTGQKTKVSGDEGTITFLGAPAAQLGLVSPVSVDALGQDIPVYGLYINEFPRYPDAPTKIQAYGTATVEVVAAGRST